MIAKIVRILRTAKFEAVAAIMLAAALNTAENIIKNAKRAAICRNQRIFFCNSGRGARGRNSSARTAPFFCRTRFLRAFAPLT